jgi:hypothetical protein
MGNVKSGYFCGTCWLNFPTLKECMDHAWDCRPEPNRIKLAEPIGIEKHWQELLDAELPIPPEVNSQTFEQLITAEDVAWLREIETAFTGGAR